MPQMLELEDREFKIMVISKLNSLIEKETVCRDKWVMKAET